MHRINYNLNAKIVPPGKEAYLVPPSATLWPVISKEDLQAQRRLEEASVTSHNEVRGAFSPIRSRPSFRELDLRKAEKRRRFETINTAIDLVLLGDDLGLANALCQDSWLVSFRKSVTDEPRHPGDSDVPDNFRLRVSKAQSNISSFSACSSVTSGAGDCWHEVQPGETLLHLACRMANPRAVKLLVHFGTDTNMPSLEPYFNTPLHIAAGSDMKEIIDILLQNGAQSAALNYLHENAFHCSCKAGAQESALKILRMGIVSDINARNDLGQTAMLLACSTGLREVVIECLRHGASLTEEPDLQGNSLLHAACEGNQGEMAIFLINNGSSPGGRGIFPNRAGFLPIDLIHDENVKKDLLKANIEFMSAGGITGLKLRRKDAEVAMNVSLESEGKGGYTALALPACQPANTNMPEVMKSGAAGFNWFKELKSVDTRKGITSSHDAGVYLIQASKHGKVKTIDQDSDSLKTDQKAKVLSSEDVNSALLQEDPIRTHQVVNKDTSSAPDTDLHSLSSAELLEVLGRAFDNKDRTRSTLQLGSGHMQAVPSVRAFLIDYCGFSEDKAERCAGIARLRNCLHINKLYDILQTVEAMKFTNFSFKDIGVFHMDEARVRQALKDYYASGQLTSFGKSKSINKGFETAGFASMGVLAGGRIATHAEGLAPLVYRGVKPALGRHFVEQKYQPEEIQRRKDEHKADILKHLYF